MAGSNESCESTEFPWMKMIVVARCSECPHHGIMINVGDIVCTHPKICAILEDSNEIPEWCPLDKFVLPLDFWKVLNLLLIGMIFGITISGITYLLTMGLK